MRHLLNTLYVLSADTQLSLEGENVVVKQEKQEIAKLPLHILESIVCFAYSGATPALMGACAKLGVDLVFFTPQGKFLARIVGEENGNVLLRQAQYRMADDPSKSCLYAREFIRGKVYNGRWVLERATRDHPQQVSVDALKHTAAQMNGMLSRIETCTDMEQLRGLEGTAAQEYFSCFDALILKQKEDFTFSTRNRRPPLDNVNALLSLTYSLLANDCASAARSVGLDPYVGFLHRARSGRLSMALDLMEELRAIYADRFVLSCINKKILTGRHFQKQEDGEVRLTAEGWRIFIKAWQNKKKEQLTHPVLGEKISWGLVPYTQAMLLARTLRGEADTYPPFLWK